MKLEVQWLAHLLIEANILNPAHCRILKSRLPKDIEAEEFGETLADYDLCSDRDLVRSLVTTALQKSRNGEAAPPNPFATGVEARAATATEAGAAPSAAPRSAPPPSAPTPVAAPAPAQIPRAAPASTPAPAPQRTAPSAGANSPAASPSVQLSDEMPRFDAPAASGMPCFDAHSARSPETARQTLAQALLACHTQGISDLHLSAGARPFARRDRRIVYLGDAPLDAACAQRLNTAFLSPLKLDRLETHHDLDYALALAEDERFRVNVMEHKEGYAGTYRVVSDRIRSLQELGFDSTEHLERLLDYHNGLILVTGPVGSGKTTTLAALVDYINQHRRDHVICVEEPIEITHRSAQCQITQREVGTHTKTFHSALKGALRQDPDIIVIGEMRDLETIEMAISASETGHLVIGTMHTSNAATTLNRLLDVFPAAQQQQIRAMVSESLRGIVCQRLLPGKSSGTHLAMELLISNVAVKSMIRESKIDGLSNVIETGARQGMTLMDKSIMKLWQAGKISGAVARSNLVSDMLKNQIPA